MSCTQMGLVYDLIFLSLSLVFLLLLLLMFAIYLVNRDYYYNKNYFSESVGPVTLCTKDEHSYPCPALYRRYEDGMLKISTK